MANGNGSMVKALGVAGLVIGVVGGAFGLAATVGPTHDIKAIELRVQKCEAARDELTAFRGSVETDIKYIRETLVEIKERLQ